MTRPAIRPSRLWYLVAATLVLAALLCIAVGVVGLIATDIKVDNFRRVAAPGSGTVTFIKPGRYLVYLETKKPFQLPPGLTIGLLVEPRNGGGPIAVTRVEHGSNVTAGRRVDRVVASLVIPRPGNYTLTVGQPPLPFVESVAIGQDLTPGIVRSVVLIVAPILTLIPVAIAVVAITAIRRYLARHPRSPPRPPPAPWLHATPAPPAAAPPGWYADPTGHHQHRYWDGSGWSDRVSNHAVPGTGDPEHRQ
jgi:hypothetical protein